MKMRNLVVLASGSGSNAENIIRFFKLSKNVKVSYLLSNRPDAYALQRAKALGVSTMVFNRDDFYNNGKVANFLREEQPDLIVLAGFLWLVPQEIIKNFPNRIINIHPALLPKYGGKGMYGDKVHRAIIENGERESGITIHFVNEKYDEGSTIFQARCTLSADETSSSLAEKIHNLEHEHFPRVIQQVLESLEQ